MDRKQTEELAKTWFDALGRCDTDTMSRLSTDDMTWWVVPGNKFSGTHTKQQYLGNLSKLFENASGVLKMEYMRLPEKRIGYQSWLRVTCR